MNPKPIDISLLDNSNSASEAYANIYHYRKAFNKKMSLRYLCKKSGISSSGYLSDVFKGKRKLNEKYVDKLNEALQLDPNFSSYLAISVQIEKSKNPDAKEKLIQTRNQIRKLLSYQKPVVPNSLEKDLLFHVIVMSSFALFAGKPTRKQLFEHFGTRLSSYLASSLNSLLEQEFITEDDGILKLEKSHLFFADSKNGNSHIDFVKQGLSDAINSLEKWYSTPNQSAIYSSVISTKKKDFEAKIPELKKQIIEMQNELDSDEADQLIRFNLLIYPFEINDL